MAMFDFGAIGSVAETLQTGVRDIDSRLEAIETMMRVQTVIAVRSRLDRLYMMIEDGTSDDEHDAERAELTAILAALSRFGGGVAAVALVIPIEHSGKMPDVDWSNDARPTDD